HAEDCAVQEDVLAARQLGVKASSHLQQCAERSVDLRGPFSGIRDVGKDLEQGRLASAVTADDTDDFTSSDLERDVFQRPEKVRRRLTRAKRFGDDACNGVTKRLVALALRTDSVALAEPFDLEGRV